MADIGYLKNEPEKALGGVVLEQIYKERKNIPADGNRKSHELRKCIDCLKKGDTLHIGSIDELSTDLVGLKRIISLLRGKKNTVISHEEKIELTPEGLEVLRVAIEFEEKIRKKRVSALTKVKKRQGPDKNAEVIDQAISLINSGVPKSVIAKEMGVSRETLYKWLRVRKEALKKIHN